METERIFNVIYSNVSEDLKNAVLDTALYEMGEEQSFSMLTESYADGLSEMLTDYVDLIAHRAASEEDLDEAIESVLNLVDTDTINIVAESFMDREVRRALFEREETINELFGFGKSEERKAAEGEVKAAKQAAAGAQANLKNVLATQKKNLGSIKKSEPIGLASIRRNAKTQQGDVLKAGKATKAAERAGEVARRAQASLNDVKARERKEAIDKVKGAAKSVWNKFKGAVKSGVEAAKNKAAEVKDNTVNAVKAGAEVAKNKANEVKSKVTDAAKSAVAKGAGAVAGAATKVANKANEVRARAEGSGTTLSNKANTITKTKAELEEQRKLAQDAYNDPSIKNKRYYANRIKTLDGQIASMANEAFTTAVALIAATNISESAFMEIMEKVNSLKVTPKAKEVVGKEHRAKYEKILDLMQKRGDYSPKMQAEAESEGKKADKCGQ